MLPSGDRTSYIIQNMRENQCWWLQNHRLCAMDTEDSYSG